MHAVRIHAAACGLRHLRMTVHGKVLRRSGDGRPRIRWLFEREDDIAAIEGEHGDDILVFAIAAEVLLIDAAYLDVVGMEVR